MRRVAEVIDAWFDSGSMPFAQFHYPFENEELFEERFPADFICEAIDQTRGWFYSLLAESVLLFDTSSYRNCVCLGLILDPEGQKMSKSRGNVVEPWDVIDRHGADAFRWYYFTSQQPWAGYRFSVETVGEAVRQFLLTLWNTYSFWVPLRERRGLETGELPYVPEWTSSEAPSVTELDRWARLAAAAHDRRGRASRWTPSTARPPAARSPTTSRSSPTGTCASPAAASGTATPPRSRPCASASVETAKLLAPFTPFIAEEIYANLARRETGLDEPVDQWTNRSRTRSTSATSRRSTRR